MRQRAAERIAQQVVRPLWLQAAQISEMTIDHLLDILAGGDGAIRSWRLQPDDGVAPRQITAQPRVLPGETGSRMQAEQRRALAGPQLQAFADAAALGRVGRLRVIEQVRHLLQAAGEHDLPDAQWPRDAPTQLSRQTHRQQRMAAQREEVVVGIHRLAPQQFPEQRRQQAFAVALRRTPGLQGQLRPWQRLAIQLAAGAEREAVGHDIADRHHVRRQTLLQRLMQLGGIQRHARLGDQPGDQLAHIGAAQPRRALAQLDGVHRRLRYPPAVPAEPVRFRPARCAGRGSSAGRRCAPNTRRCRLPASGRYRRCDTCARRCRRDRRQTAAPSTPADADSHRPAECRAGRDHRRNRRVPAAAWRRECSAGCSRPVCRSARRRRSPPPMPRRTPVGR